MEPLPSARAGGRAELPSPLAASGSATPDAGAGPEAAAGEGADGAGLHL